MWVSILKLLSIILSFEFVPDIQNVNTVLILSAGPLLGRINHLAATNAWEVLSQDRIYASILVKNAPHGINSVLGPFQTHISEKIA